MANTENLYNTKMVYGEFADKNSSDSWSVNSAIQKLKFPYFTMLITELNSAFQLFFKKSLKYSINENAKFSS